MWERKSGREAWYLNSKSCHLDTERNPDPSGQRLCSKPSLLVAYAAALGQRRSPRSKLQKGPGPCGSPMGSTLPPQSILLPTSVRPLAGHRVTRDSRGVSPSGKSPRIAVGNVCTKTHGPIIPSGFSKRNGWEGEKRSEEGPGRREERLVLGLPFSPSLAAAVPAVGAGLGPLWGGNILLPVLGGGGRACPLANLDGEEETGVCSGLPHGSLRSARGRSPWKPGTVRSKPRVAFALSLGHPWPLNHQGSRSLVGLSAPWGF